LERYCTLITTRYTCISVRYMLLLHARETVRVKGGEERTVNPRRGYY